MGCKKLNIRNFFTFNGRGNTAFHYDSKGNWNSIIANGPLESRAHNEVNQLTVREASPLTYDETGLVYYNYRYYNAELGRWLSRDPIEEKGGFNLYGMVGNNPINNMDMIGLISCFLPAQKDNVCMENCAIAYVHNMTIAGSVLSGGILGCALMPFPANLACMGIAGGIYAATVIVLGSIKNTCEANCPCITYCPYEEGTGGGSGGGGPSWPRL